MTSRHFLAVVAIAQGALLVALIILIILNRWFRLRRRARVHPRVLRLNTAMQKWAFGTTDLTEGTPIDPGPPPMLGDPSSDATIKDMIVEVIRDSSELDPKLGD